MGQLVLPSRRVSHPEGTDPAAKVIPPRSQSFSHRSRAQGESYHLRISKDFKIALDLQAYRCLKLARKYYSPGFIIPGHSDAQGAQVISQPEMDEKDANVNSLLPVR